SSTPAMFLDESCLVHPDRHSFPTRRSSDLPIEDMKQFLDGILHIYDEGRTAVKMGDLFGIVTAAEERVAEKENFRGTLTSENARSEEHTSELQSRFDLVCRLLLEKKKEKQK